MAADALMPKAGWVRRYVDLYTPLSEAPAEAHMATSLAVLSAAIGWRAYIRWGENAEPCNLFVMLEGGSATAKKTTTARTGSGLVRHAMQDVPSGEESLSVRSVSHTSRKGLLELVGTDSKETAKSWETVPPPGVLLDWDEFGAILGRPGDVKGSDYLGQIRATLMEIYGGRHGGIQTGAVKFPASRCAVSILATMTRQELEQRVSTGLLRDGFLGRFVMIPHPGRRTYLSEPPAWTSRDSQARDELAAFLRRVSTSKHELGDIFKRQTPEAHDARREWYDRRMRELDKAAEHGGEIEQSLADAMGRLQSTAAKIAGVLAVSSMDPDEELSEVRVEVSDVEAGIAFAEHALAEVGSLATSGGGMPADRYGVRVVEWLRRRNGAGPVSRKELMDTIKADGMDSKRRWEVIEQLHHDGRVDIVKEQTSGRPRLMVSLL